MNNIQFHKYIFTLLAIITLVSGCAVNQPENTDSNQIDYEKEVLSIVFRSNVLHNLSLSIIESNNLTFLHKKNSNRYRVSIPSYKNLLSVKKDLERYEEIESVSMMKIIQASGGP